MTKAVLTKRICVPRMAVLVLATVAGCGDSSTPAVPSPAVPSPAAQPISEADAPSAQAQITFYVAGMNQRLKILWGDWPNTVKQALVELDAVESVEDEWERELESDEDLDLLFVAYDPQRITVDELKTKISEFGFEAKVPISE